MINFRDVFRLRLGSDKPANFPPMEIKSKPDAEPGMVKPRRYAPNQTKFLKKEFRNKKNYECFTGIERALEVVPL